MSWEEQARCRQYDPEIFFAPRARAERKAKTICAKCPVKVDCLVFALQAKVEFGIWGGTNGKERRAMIRSSPVGTDWREEIQGIGVTA
jgi:WhiB family transcriptional regulator, redox-sensing transcriptional regulator